MTLQIQNECWLNTWAGVPRAASLLGQAGVTDAEGTGFLG